MLTKFLTQLIGILSSLIVFYTKLNPTTHIPVRPLAESYDFIVVGAGSAGAVLASRLSEAASVRVLLLEAGGDENILTEIPAVGNFFRLTPFDWKYSTEPQDHACLGYNNKQCGISSGKVIGGSSTINNMFYVRGNRRDYDNWSSLGNYGWSWKEVLPYFLKSEDNTSPWMASNTEYHHTGGLLTVSEVPFHTPLLTASLQAAYENGYSTIDINGETQTGIMPVAATMRKGARCSTAKAFIRPAAKRPNLHIILNAFVTKITFDNKKRATGVIFEHNRKTHSVKSSKEVIISAGAIRSPQLLMLSGIGPRKHLEEHGIPVINELPGVGQNLQDHVMFGGAIWTLEEPVAIMPKRLIRPQYLLDWILYGTGPLTTVGTLESVAFVKTPYANASDDWPDIQILCVSASLAADVAQLVRTALGFSDESWYKYLAPVSKKDTFLIAPTVLRPKSRGFIKLRTTNPHDHPIIDPRYLSHQDDLNTLIEGIKISLAFGNASAYRSFGARFIPTVFPGCETVTLYSEAYWICIAHHYSYGVYHPSGTAKMGPKEDPMAVVDPELKVYGVTGLRVADTSIMPNIVSGNTNAPAIMIGEKLADIIKCHWNLG